MEIEKTLTIEEADAFYEWFLDLYGRKRAKAELKQSGRDGWKEGFKEGFIESFTESFIKNVTIRKLIMLRLLWMLGLHTKTT